MNPKVWKWCQLQQKSNFAPCKHFLDTMFGRDCSWLIGSWSKVTACAAFQNCPSKHFLAIKIFYNFWGGPNFLAGIASHWIFLWKLCKALFHLTFVFALSLSLLLSLIFTFCLYIYLSPHLTVFLSFLPSVTILPFLTICTSLLLSLVLSHLPDAPSFHLVFLFVFYISLVLLKLTLHLSLSLAPSISSTLFLYIWLQQNPYLLDSYTCE